MKMTESELRELAGQLRMPGGEQGIKVGEMMQFTNGNLISKVIEALGIKDNDMILEIGPGNGAHIQTTFRSFENFQYHGVDISETMVREAEKLNEGNPNVTFTLIDGKMIPFSSDTFDKIATANTIYFWDDPDQYSKEITRVMKTGGRLSIGFIPKSTMQHIPFAKYGFTMYDIESVKALLEKAGLQNITANSYSEMVTSNSGEQIEREFVIVTAQK